MHGDLVQQLDFLAAQQVIRPSIFCGFCYLLPKSYLTIRATRS